MVRSFLTSSLYSIYISSTRGSGYGPVLGKALGWVDSLGFRPIVVMERVLLYWELEGLNLLTMCCRLVTEISSFWLQSKKCAVRYMNKWEND